MTTSVTSVLPASSTDAQFRTWGLALSTALAAVGMVQTSDTGQINWASVTNPASDATDAGYEIWKFNDTKQSAVPIYMKIRYGLAKATPYWNLRIQIDFGEGSNGSGTLTGTTATSVVDMGYTSNTGVGSAAAQPMVLAAGPGYLTFAWAVSGNAATQAQFSFTVERLRDVTGLPDSRGYWVRSTRAALTTTNQFQTYILGSGFTGYPYLPVLTPTYEGSSNTNMLSANGSLVNAGVAYACPWRPMSGQNVHGLFEKTLSTLSVGTNDFPPDSFFQMRRWDGSLHRYRRIAARDAASNAGTIGALTLAVLADA